MTKQSEARIESLAQEKGWCAGHEAQPGTHTMCVFVEGGGGEFMHNNAITTRDEQEGLRVGGRGGEGGREQGRHGGEESGNQNTGETCGGCKCLPEQ